MHGNNLNDYEKAKKLLKAKIIKQKDIAENTKISYNTIKMYSKTPEKMKVASWEKVYKLAKFYDKIKDIL